MTNRTGLWLALAALSLSAGNTVGLWLMGQEQARAERGTERGTERGAERPLLPAPTVSVRPVAAPTRAPAPPAAAGGPTALVAPDAAAALQAAQLGVGWRYAQEHLAAGFAISPDGQASDVERGRALAAASAARIDWFGPDTATVQFTRPDGKPLPPQVVRRERDGWRAVSVSAPAGAGTGTG